MARLARLYVPEQPQHVILRGLDQQPAFVDDQDYELFIDCLRSGFTRSSTRRSTRMH